MDKQHTAAQERTLQDDRAELMADPHADSALTEGEGAPLAEDTVPHAASAPTIAHVMLGGAPVPLTTEDPGAAPSTGGLTAADDRPIGD